MIFSKQRKAFTLVELIVVIIILGVLSTIGFVSYSDYIAGSRDANRVNQIKDIYSGLQLYAANKKLPYPDNYITVTASGTVVSYQGYAGEGILKSIVYANGGRDPQDKSYFTYAASKDRKQAQVLGFLEETDNTQISSRTIISQSYAADYTKRYPKTIGAEVGVFLDGVTKIPVQDLTVSTLELTTTTTPYTAYFTDTDTLTASGYTLYGLTQTRLGDTAPSSCPTGFIPVPGNPEFNTKGFCVAQYEMTYSDANTPNSSGGDRNTVAYIPAKNIISQAGKYPIVDITQAEAITACKSMGSGYHLITNNEWMTITRNIEATPKNWISGKVGQGNIYNGVSAAAGAIGCTGYLGGNTEPRLYATKTGPGADTSCNTRRSHTLSNGQIVWDLSGNVWEHVNKANTVDGTNYNLGQTAITGSSTPTVWDDNGIYASADMKKYGAATGLGTSAGMGNLYYAQGVVSNTFIRGGDADEGVFTGLFLQRSDFTASSEYRSVGFRCTR